MYSILAIATITEIQTFQKSMFHVYIMTLNNIDYL